MESGKKVVWSGYADGEFKVTSFSVDRYDVVNVVIQLGNKVEHLKITIEQAQEIGLINLNTLLPYFEAVKSR